ncbi:hypothetical protein [Synechococcus sp. HJ21-Hayes]|uniref:hypothetical protein n=1 Tax=Synechococcus sp. HJ21-Hayes TaxID=2823736 RepID=UPI0020CF1ED0|nr:hypothetical protein [Synechococcus sp. HJ21-Hayes]
MHKEADEMEIAAVLRWQNEQFDKQTQMRRAFATGMLHNAANRGGQALGIPGTVAVHARRGGVEGRIDQKRRILGKTNKSAYLVEDNMDKGWGDGVNSCHTEPEA